MFKKKRKEKSSIVRYSALAIIGVLGRDAFRSDLTFLFFAPLHTPHKRRKYLF